MIKRHFKFRSSYMGCVWFDITDETGTYQAKLRTGLGDYERSILNPHAPGIQEECLSAIGLLTKCVADNRGEISQETISEFNAWRLSEHNAAMAIVQNRFPDEYDFLPPSPVYAGFWESGKHWTRIEKIPRFIGIDEIGKLALVEESRLQRA